MSCHWTTPQGVPTSSHEIPSPSVSGRNMCRRGRWATDGGRAAGGRAERPSRRHSTFISCFCKDSCTLSGGVRTLGRNIGAALVAALLMPVGALATSARTHPPFCANANLLPTPTDTATVDAATLCLIDRVRAAHHLRPLRSNHELQSVAATQVSDMVRHDYFGDNTTSGQSPGALIATIPYGAHAAQPLHRTGRRLGHALRLHPSGHRRGVDAVPSAPRNHPDRCFPRRRHRRRARRANGHRARQSWRNLRRRARRAGLIECPSEAPKSRPKTR